MEVDRERSPVTSRSQLKEVGHPKSFRLGLANLVGRFLPDVWKQAFLAIPPAWNRSIIINCSEGGQRGTGALSTFPRNPTVN